MSSWGKFDNAANAPYWAVSSAIMNVTETELNASAPTAANVELLYGNTTADVYTTNETKGLFLADQYEAQASAKIAHAGWVMKTTGSGGRAGRVQWEVLACLSSPGDDAAATEDSVLVDETITYLTSPSGVQFVAGAGNNGTFTVSATTSNPSSTLTYAWQYSTDGETYAAAANGATDNTTYVGASTNTLRVYATDVDANLYYYRVQITANNALANSNTVFTSSNAQITLL